jgi:MYXO-CTERM domain-containing protein
VYREVVDGFQEFTVVVPRLSPARLRRIEHFQHDRPIALRHSRQHARLPDADHAVIRTNPDSGIRQKSMSGIPSTRPSSGWTQEQDFVTGILENLPLNTTQVGMVQFASSAESFLNLSLLTSTSVPTIAQTVSDRAYTQGSDSALSGIVAALNLFGQDPNASDPMVLVLLTDAQPDPSTSQNPCDMSGNYPLAAQTRNELAADNVTTLVVGVGPNISVTNYQCLYNNLYESSTNFLYASTSGATVLNDIEGLGPSTAAPEPPSWTLLAVGLLSFAGLAAMRRRMKTTAACKAGVCGRRILSKVSL